MRIALRAIQRVQQLGGAAASVQHADVAKPQVLQAGPEHTVAEQQSQPVVADRTARMAGAAKRARGHRVAAAERLAQRFRGIACADGWSIVRVDLGDDVVVDPASSVLGQHVLGRMDQVCLNCGALRWLQECSRHTCCQEGRGRLPALPEPPEPLHSLFSGQHLQSKHLMKFVRVYNITFQLASCGAQIDTLGSGVPSLQIHGRIYFLWARCSHAKASARSSHRSM